jgi:hypothetical protein
MLLEFALAASLTACAAGPAAPGTYAPRQLPEVYHAAQQPGNYAGAEHVEKGCSSCGSSALWWHECGPQSFRCHFLFSPCDMHQHYPYWNKERGYYYFRPYHVAHVVMQQEKATTWGQDARNPYDNRFLDNIYEEFADEEAVKAKARKTEPLPRTQGEPEMEEPKTLPEDRPAPQPEEGSRKSSRSVKKLVKVSR